MALSIKKGLAAAALVSLSLFGNADAFWRMPCRARSGLARMDPLVNPGSISDHSHYIHGSDGFTVSADYESLNGGSCTSCEVKEDLSAYWTPALYFKSSDGEFTLVEQVGGMLAYYLLYTNSGNSSLSAFPVGFEMIAGDTLMRSFDYPVPDLEKSAWGVAPYNTQAFLRQAALGFNCLNYGKTAEGSLYRHFMPDKAYLDANCADGVRLELMFPSCWNGKDVTSSDKKSHMAYPSQVMTGDCPEDFPIRVPSMFYETIVNTPAFADQDGTFVFSNGDPTGYGYHGDFMMGWDQPFLQSAVDTCTNASGQIEDCALFTIQDSSVYGNCNFTVPSALKNDDVVGAMASLPGNAAIQYGPAYASKGVTGSAIVPSATATQVTLSYSEGISVASTETYFPGAIFALKTGESYSETSTPTSTSTSSSAVVPTTTSTSASSSAMITDAPVAALAVDVEVEGEEFFTTEYSTSGQVVYEVIWAKTDVTVTASTTTTVSASATGAAMKRHIHQHARRGRR